MSEINKELVFATSFICGAAIMILEILGFRILAPYFGYSVYVWGSLIGIIMVALSAGYYIGGNLADRKPKLWIIYSIILYSGIYTLLILFFYKLTLKALMPLGIIYGSLIGTTIIFGPPMILLSMVSPFLIKIISQSEKVGASAGKIYSISTVGSIFGVFFSTFYLIPAFGTRNSIIFSIILIFGISIVGLMMNKKKRFIFFVLLFLLLAINTGNSNPNVLFEKDSPYNLVIVEKEKDGLMLKLNQNEYFHSVIGESFYSSYLAYFLAGPLLTDTKDLAVLGMGAGASVIYINDMYPNINIDAVEIDPVVVDVANEYFGLKDINNLNIYVADAKAFIQKPQKKYDIIEIDLFQGGPYTPFYTSTKEFFTECYNALDDNGLIMMNILDASDEKILAGPIENTILTVFPSLYEIRYSSNYVVFAFKKETSFEDISEKINKQNLINPDSFLNYLNKVEYDKSIPIMTDDKAPIEQLTYKMLKEV